MKDLYPHIQVIDTQSGEVLDEHPLIQRLEDQIAGLERDIRGWTMRYADLQRDKEREAESHPDYERVKEIFDFWRHACNHKRSRFSAERFWLILPHYEKHGYAMCRLAIDGAAFDAWETTRKNGSVKRHDDWALIFKDANKFEEFCNRAPADAIEKAKQRKGNE